MLIPEAPIWGNNLSRYNPQYTPQTYHDLGRACRNHPCVARYSLTNEVREPRSERKEKWPWRAAIDDMREVEAYFANPQTAMDSIAAGHFTTELVFTVDVGPAPHRLSLYHLDYDNKSRKQSVTIADAVTGKVLDQREIGGFAQGIYQSWQVQGLVRVSIVRKAGDNAMISGIFLDPVEKAGQK